MVKDDESISLGTQEMLQLISTTIHRLPTSPLQKEERKEKKKIYLLKHLNFNKQEIAEVWRNTERAYQ